MRVGIDLRCLPADGTRGAGVAHAARALVQALVQCDTSWSWQLYVPAGSVMEVDCERVIIEDGSGAALRRGMCRAPCDILFESAGAVPFGVTVPTVPWVHDLAIYDHPEWFPQSWLRREVTTRLYQRGITRAATVCAISTETKREIVEKFGISGEKILVTGEGGDEILAALHGNALAKAKTEARGRMRTRGVPAPFMLCLGTVQPRKNLGMALDAWDAVRVKQKLACVIAGGRGWNADDVERRVAEYEKNGAPCKRFTSVSDHERRDLLLAADVVLVPSWHEGFGLVALEAMQAGSAVIVSSAGALPEVVGNGGMMCDPGDAKGWAALLEKLISSEAERGRVADYGKKRATEFSWKKTAEIVVEAIGKINMR